MRYVPERHLLFIHVPKTGGVSVEQALDAAYRTKTVPHYWYRISGRHATLAHLRDNPKTRAWTEGSFKFCFVRHPVDWYVSLWRWFQDATEFRKTKNDVLRGAFRGLSWHPKRPLVPLMDDDFGAFVANVCERYPGYLTRLYEQYAEGMNFVGRTENLAADLRALGVPGDAPVANQSVHPKPQVTRATVRLIQETERGAIGRWYR